MHSSTKTPTTSRNQAEKQARLVDKLIGDLEELCKKFAEIQQQQIEENSGDGVIRDDLVELQKFCSKLEFLIQFRLREKKSTAASSTLASMNTSIMSPSLNISSSSATPGSSATANESLAAASNREYWSFLLDVFKSSKSFQDAIKYVKSVKEVKTSLGKGRVFLRFCLQYHRLADAMQQLTMDNKVLAQWYVERAVWFDETNKSRIIQMLYDLNEIEFELVAKNDFELDTTWPVLNIHTNKQYKNFNPNQLNYLMSSRYRTSSMSSFASYGTNIDRDQNADSNSILLSTTPLEMDDDFAYSSINMAKDADAHSLSKQSEQCKVIGNENENEKEKIDRNSSEIDSYREQLRAAESKHEQYEKKIEELTSQLANKESQLSGLIDQLKRQKDDADTQLASALAAASLKTEIEKTSAILKLNEKIESLQAELAESTSRLTDKDKQIDDLEAKLAEQLHMGDSLTHQATQSDSQSNEHLVELEERLASLASDKQSLEEEIASLRFELSAKTMHEENLLKETLTQSHSTASLKQMCSEQEHTINRFKLEFDKLREEQSIEMEKQFKQAEHSKMALQLKEEEVFTLTNQLNHSKKLLDEETTLNGLLSSELAELKQFYKKVNEQNLALIKQLEMDNAEIKKRLVKLIREKADLWQKADNLEYENLLKSSAMWIDDSNVSTCMHCNATFSLMLRKHHCRICLKIYCYYCCNNWVEYNNSKLRVCKKCYEARESVNIMKKTQLTDADEASSASFPAGGATSATTPLSVTNAEDEEDEDDADINFEVRADMLNRPTRPGDNFQTFTHFDEFRQQQQQEEKPSPTSSLAKLANHQAKFSNIKGIIRPRNV